MNKELMNSVSMSVLSQGMRTRMFPKNQVFIRKLEEHSEVISGFLCMVYQSIDEFGNEVGVYGGDADFAFKTATEDGFEPVWYKAH